MNMVFLALTQNQKRDNIKTMLTINFTLRKMYAIIALFIVLKLLEASKEPLSESRVVF
jgi:hypothetical protein